MIKMEIPYICYAILTQSGKCSGTTSCLIAKKLRMGRSEPPFLTRKKTPKPGASASRDKLPRALMRHTHFGVVDLGSAQSRLRHSSALRK